MAATNGCDFQVSDFWGEGVTLGLRQPNQRTFCAAWSQKHPVETETHVQMCVQHERMHIYPALVSPLMVSWGFLLSCAPFPLFSFFPHLALTASVRLIAKQQWQPWQICALAQTMSNLTLVYPLPHKKTKTKNAYTRYINLAPCWFVVYDTNPRPHLRTTPWSSPPPRGDRREASSWMELLCFSPEGFDPLPFVPQISAYPASLERGLDCSLI